MDGAGSGAAVTDAFSLLNLNLADNVKLNFGASDDLQIYHDGSNSIIHDNGTGRLQLQSSRLDINKSDGSEGMAAFIEDAQVILYYDNAVKFQTTSTGVDVTGVITTDGMTTSADINFGDNDKAVFGDGSDLEIYHDGSNSYIKEAGIGNFYILGQTSMYFRNSGNTETYAAFNVNGAVQLYYDNDEKLATTSYGIDISGSVVADTQTAGTVTGTTTADFDTYQNFVWTLTGNVTLDNPSTEKVGQSGFITFIQDGTGGRTVSLGTDYETAGGAGLTLSSTASATDVVPYIVVASNRILLGAPQLAFS
jgi:hypothetical protein